MIIINLIIIILFTNMGGYTVYDALIDNPAIIYYINNIKVNKKLFDWHNKVRVVLKSGEITDIGYYNGEGCVVINKSFFFNKKYKVVDNINKNNNNFDGFILIDKIYKLLKSNKKFNKCIKNKNLYTLLKDFNSINKKNTGPPKEFKNLSSQYVYYDDKFLNEDSISKKDIWSFTNPEIKSKDGIKNKKRIEKIINLFINFICKSNKNNKANNKVNINKKNKVLSLYYELTNNKSNKYWHIQYNNDGEYIIKYGRIGKNGKIIKKNDKLYNIKKLIESKIKKGYKLIIKKNIKTFII